MLAVAVSGSALAEGGDDGLVEKDDGNAWHFRVGPVMAPRVRARVRGPRMVMPAKVATAPNSAASGTGGGSAVADPSAGYTDRRYADGYVGPDEGTGNPDSMVPGLTWNWGAANVGAQYSGGRMEFRADMAGWSESVSSSSTSYGRGGSSHDSDRDILLGVEAMGGWTFFNDGTFDAAVDAGFRFYGSGDLKSESKYGTSVTTTRMRSEYRFVDSYDASWWTDVPSGSYEGTAGGPGRLIGATPTRREELMNSTSSSETHSYFYRDSTKLDYRIWDLRLGPTVGWKALDWLAVRGGVYGLLGLVDARLRTSDAKRSTCDAVFGLAAGLSAQINFTESLFLVGGVEYDWWSDEVSMRAGGADARIELSDYSVSLAVGVEF